MPKKINHAMCFCLLALQIALTTGCQPSSAPYRRPQPQTPPSLKALTAEEYTQQYTLLLGEYRTRVEALGAGPRTSPPASATPEQVQAHAANELESIVRALEQLLQRLDRLGPTPELKETHSTTRALFAATAEGGRKIVTAIRQQDREAMEQSLQAMKTAVNTSAENLNQATTKLPQDSAVMREIRQAVVDATQ